MLRTCMQPVTPAGRAEALQLLGSAGGSQMLTTTLGAEAALHRWVFRVSARLFIRAAVRCSERSVQ